MKSVCWILGLLILASPIATPKAFCATVDQTDHALVVVERSVNHATALLEEGSIPTRPLPRDVAIKVLGPIHMISEPGVPPSPFDPSYLIKWLGNAGSNNNNSRRIDDYNSIVQMIETMRAQVKSLKHPLADTSALVHAVTRTELSDTSYGYDKPPDSSMMDKFGDWLGKQIQSILNKLFSNKQAPSSNFNYPVGLFTTLYRIAQVILCCVLLAIVTYLVVTIVRWFINRQAGFRPLAADDAAEAALLDARDSDSILARANQLADSGDFRRAFRLIYLAALVTLDTDGILHFDRSRTNWEYLRELRRAGRQDLYNQLVPFTREFDRIWYGFGSVDASSYATAVNRYKDLKTSMSATSTLQSGAPQMQVKP